MPSIKKYTHVYIKLIIFFTLSMILVYCLPNNLVENQNVISNDTLNREGDYPIYLYNTEAAMLDNFTDSSMINKAYVENGVNPLYDAMDAENYARYWHGYQVILRPLMTIFSYEQIRYINSFVLLGLIFILYAKLYKESGLKIALPLLLGILSCYLTIIPSSLQFGSVFYVSTIASIILLNKRKDKNCFDFGIFIFIVGSITNFVDYLTVPLITLGIPLLIYLGLKLIDKEIITFKEIILYSLSWVFGYGFTWLAKWAIGSMVLQRNVFLEAIESIVFRTSSDSISRFDAIYANFKLMFLNQGDRVGLLWIIMVVVLIFLFIYKRQNVKSNYKILLVALYPYIWYFVLSNHSMIHYWFTYRLQLITIFSIIMFFALSIDFSHYKKYLEKINKIRNLSNNEV